jgi:LysM repeat protein
MRHIRTLFLLVAFVGASAASTAAFDATSTYTVRRGDTLSSIAARLRVPIRSLAVANHLVNADRILAGQVLHVPGVGGGGVARRTAPFTGLGTWVDVYDFSPSFQAHGQRPLVTPAAVDQMAAAHVRTLYLQAASPAAPGRGVIDPTIVGAFLTRAHARGIRVVAWHLPTFRSVAADAATFRAISRFTSAGQHFDGIGADIEWTLGVPDNAARSRALVALSRQVRATTSQPLAAIVMPPVLLDVVNPGFWPGFPWRSLSPLYDAWMPMDYWTLRSSGSVYRNATRYTSENVSRLRADLGDPSAAVHPIGGISATSADYAAFARASRARGAIGWSVYDFNTTTTKVWPSLR